MEKLWQVSYTYDIPADRPPFRTTQKYFVVAVYEDEAFTKADDLFSYCEYNCDLLIKDLVSRKAKIYSRKIPSPKLSGSDVEEYSLEAKLLESGRLGFIPVKKE